MIFNLTNGKNRIPKDSQKSLDSNTKIECARGGLGKGLALLGVHPDFRHLVQKDAKAFVEDLVSPF